MDKYTKRQNPVALFSAKVDYLWMHGEISRGMLWRREIKLGECCLCQAETSGHLITDKWGLVLASARINPFCKHSYPNLLNMSFHNCTKPKVYFHHSFSNEPEIDQGRLLCASPWNVNKWHRIEVEKKKSLEIGVTTCTWPTMWCPHWSPARHLTSPHEYSCGRVSLLLPA